jgi:mannonate dehydratase
MRSTWRWFGPGDPVSLKDIRQAGAEGIVSALHHIPNGEIWTRNEIKKRKAEIEAENFTWDVVESLPVHEAIKTGSSNKDSFIEKYKKSLENLAGEGINHVVYNFMALTDWTRTNLNYADTDGAITIRYDHIDLIVFDLFILKRPEARKAYSEGLIKKAYAKFEKMSAKEKSKLTDIILMGLPGTVEDLSINEFQEKLKAYHHIGKAGLRENLAYFLKEILPTAEILGITMSIHADDPPFPILGLPRIASDREDLNFICDLSNSSRNMLCFCSGTLGANHSNYVESLVKEFAPRISFAHLRNVKLQEDGSFFESKLFDGSINMVEIAKSLVEEQKRRKNTNKILFRPDHGQIILDDPDRKTYPGYPAIGRLKSLAELRGIFKALESL